jgi:hypothetical protein
MKTFSVQVKETWIQEVIVEAETPEEAIKKVEEGEGDYNDNGFEKSETLGSDTWLVFEL